MGALVLLAAIWSGGLTKAADWIADQFVGNIADAPTEPAPAKAPHEKEQEREGQERQR